MKIMKLASEMRDSFFTIIRANTAATVSEANDASLKIINTLIAETKTTADEITKLREDNEMMLTDIRRTGVAMRDFKAEIERLRAALLAFADHFGPLEDNELLHVDARRCFALARAALGGEHE